MINSNRIYKPEELPEVLKLVRPFFRFAQTNKKLKYFNVPCSFDIETTSFFRSTGNDKEEPEKLATMYVWTFGIMGAVIIGRSWEEYENMINHLAKILDLNENKRLMIYCHNLAFEFQFMRKHFEWSKVFAIENHKPIYAITANGIEYRCSLLLSGYSLAKLAENLQTYDIKKLVGDLDYSLMRHCKTPLTTQELAYCVNDVKIVMAYIAECIDQSGNIAKIPLTKTGYVRNYCRNSCFYTPGKTKKEDYKRLEYSRIINRLRLTEDEYKQLKRAFQGGFTHANSFCYGKVISDVTSYDFTSSYPSVMLAEQFPMGSSERIDNISREKFYKSLSLYCCVFDIEFINIRPAVWFEHYITRSRCYNVSPDCQTDNGRVVKASVLCTTITEQDFLIIRKFYKWDKFRVSNFRRYKKGYLPTDFVKAILKLYQDKTTLKDVEGKEVEYLNAKEMLNSCFGMCVTDIVREEFIYENSHWLDSSEKPPIDYETSITKYNNNRGRFLFYPWGVWVTAYARRNLFSGILEFAGDYIYSDTDSIKGKNAKAHERYIKDYNARIRKQLQYAMEYHKIPIDAIEPKTKDGISKCLGVWDFDGHYSRFKTLGAKRYLVQYSDDERNKKKNRGQYMLTVAGLNKQNAIKYLCRDNNPFEEFSENLEVPKEFTGKNIHTYIEDMKEGELTDYTGVTAHWRELSAINLDTADYSLKISREYSDYLLSISTDEW